MKKQRGGEIGWEGERDRRAETQRETDRQAEKDRETETEFYILYKSDTKFRRNVENIQIFPSTGFNCLFCQHVYKRNGF